MLQPPAAVRGSLDLVDSSLDLVDSMPYHIRLAGPDGNEVLFTHASMNGTRDGVYPETSDQELHGKIYPKPDAHTGSTHLSPSEIEANDAHSHAKGHAARSKMILKHGLTLPGSWNNDPGLTLFAVGHTHRPLVRPLNGTLVVNAGSAGLPFDLDTRPSYARLEYRRGGWQTQIVRVDYDMQRAEQDFFSTGYLEGGGPLIRLVLIELQQARSQLFQWTKRYQARVLHGELSMEKSVQAAIEEKLDWED